MRKGMRVSVRRFSSSTARWNVAIVGSGPAGFYAADFLLKKNEHVHVTMFERLPAPYGLVRYGVAPDHPEVKNVTDRFEEIASHERFSYFGNVSVGAPPPLAPPPPSEGGDGGWAQELRRGILDFGSSLGGVGAELGPRIEIAALRSAYDAVLLSYGASASRSLGVPGEELRGVHPAREFVAWYNGHPEWEGEGFDLSRVETVVVVGNGNVALDCARVLAKDVDELAPTDICERAVEALRASAVRQVAILGRRGVLQAAFTIKELRELTKLARVSTSIEAPPDAFSAAVLAAAAEDRPRKRLVELMKSLVPEGGSGGGGGAERRSVRLQFQRSPVEFVEGGSGRLGAVRVAATELQGAPGASQRAAAVAGSEEEVPCELALTSVGYRSLPIEGVPFDEARSDRDLARSDRDLAEIWPRYGRDMAEVWPRYGRSMAEVWPRCGRDAAHRGQRGARRHPRARLPEIARDCARLRELTVQARGVVPNEGGRVSGEAGLYVAGWLKRGPSGVILTNVGDAAESVAALLSDHAGGLLPESGGGGDDEVRELLAQHGGPVVEYEGVRRLVAEEARRGAADGKVAHKLVDLEEMIEVARG